MSSLRLAIRTGDGQARRLALQMPDEVNQLVQDAATRTRLEATLLQHLLRTPSRRCPTTLAVRRLEVLNRGLQGDAQRQGRSGRSGGS